MGVNRFGDKALQRALKKFGDAIIEDAKALVAETAYLIQAQARALAPHDSGYLRQSIEVDILNGGLTAKVTVGAEYAIYIEYGTGVFAVEGNGRKDPWVYYSDKYGRFVFTKGMKAQPFWMQAVDSGRKHFGKEVKKLGG
ncbi:HK97-gp10 family putative phage morphogenesis protein [Bacillus sp. JJ722]|uniref:HK97-gp10 family putative phage morphogenesis protein n=1 Tax=Bacillus sp. JJ722 TaxID=3122973 RepID=UPI002FFE616A